jgi:UDP-glucose 4-epimerase
VVPRFITAVLAHRIPTIFGDGTQSRDFTYVENIVEANLLALEAPAASGEMLNVACGERFTLLELLAEINRLLGADVRPNHAPRRPADVWHSQASIEKARRVLGYRPTVSFAEGVARTVAWYRAEMAPGSAV